MMALYLVIGATLSIVSIGANGHRTLRPMAIEFLLVTLGWLPITLFVIAIGTAILASKVIRRERDG